MNRQRPNSARFAAFFGLLGLGLVLAATPADAAPTRVAARDLPDELAAALLAPVRERVGDLAKEKNAAGATHKRGFYSKVFTKVDDSTYLASLTHDTAEPADMVTERVELTLKKEGDKWVIAGEEVKDHQVLLHRSSGTRFYPFKSFAFDREGMKVTGGEGQLAEWYFQDQVAGFMLTAKNLKYDYTAPDYLDYYQLHKMMQMDYAKEITFDPELIRVRCDPETCEQLLASSFKGLERPKPSEAGTPVTHDASQIPSWVDSGLKTKVQEGIKDVDKLRKDYPFAMFRRPTLPGNRWYTLSVRKNDKEAVGISYDNWDGYEVKYWVEVNWPDVGHQFSDVFGYFTEETKAKKSPYELELRDDEEARWHHLHSLSGVVEAALDDPEMMHGDINYGVTIKQDLKELPVVIATIRNNPGEDNERKPRLFMNSVEYQGQELTYIKTGAYTGLIVFPEELKAGTKIDLRMVFSNRAIYKVNHAFSQMLRGGWLPLVRFGDMIDTFELTVKAPAQYEILGIGARTSETVEGDVKISHWVSKSPVVFPTIIFGRYESSPAKIVAKKIDGTEIPVRVHVDKVSMRTLNDASFVDEEDMKGAMAQGAAIKGLIDSNKQIQEMNSGARGIRGKQLSPIGDQAVNSINLYEKLSGVDYPYGELNLVNDPTPSLYGQAPSSLIYLGSAVFRGEGTMAGSDTLTQRISAGGGGTGIAKFLKSVTAHEVGHQWWGSAIANKNQRNYWFVESLAEFFSALYLEAVYGPKEYQEQVDEWRRRILDVDQRVSVQNASVLWQGENPGAGYQAAVYNKGPYAFHILRQTFGDEKFFPFLREFTMRLAEKGEIVSRDIQTVAEEALGGVDPDGNPYKVDLEWFFDQWIRSAGIPEYAFMYDVRETEDGGFLITGNIKQRVVVGNKYKNHEMEGTQYRGVVPIFVKTKKNEYERMVVVEGAETPFQLKVPDRPLEVALNQNGKILSFEPTVNKSW